jgi:hypothetical protein
MDNQRLTRPLQNLWIRFWPWLIVLLILLFIGSIRVRLLNMPLERDEGEYAYAGQLILQGIPPYELAYNMKLPGTYYAYAAGMAMFGQTAAGIHLTLLTVNTVTIIFVFLLGRKLFGVTAGLAACASYGLMSLSREVLGMAAHATQFVVLFAVPGTLLLWRALQTGKARAIFFSGLLYGLAFVMKQQGIFFGIFGLLILFRHERRAASSIAHSARKISPFVLGAALPFTMICLYLAGAGVFPKFWFWTFSYARAYATTLTPAEGFVNFSDSLRDQSGFFAGFWILVAAGLIVALRKNSGRPQLSFVLTLFFFSFLATGTGLYFRQHYFVLLLPAFALLTGLAVKLLAVASPRFMQAAAALLFAAVLARGMFVERWAFFLLPPATLFQEIYLQNPFVESVTVARYLRAHSPPTARVAVIGSEPEIYFYAHRHSATGFIYTYPLMENQPYAVAMQHEMIHEIETAKPQFLVLVANRYSWLAKLNSDGEIFAWMDAYSAGNYDRVGIVDSASGVELWDDDAKNCPSPPVQYLGVFRRKTSR